MNQSLGGEKPLLEPGETVLAAGAAMVILGRQGLTTLFPIGTLIRLGYFFLDIGRARDLRAKSSAFGFPMDRYMLVMLTSKRLMTWRSSRFRRNRKEPLGSTLNTSIVSATAPYVSGGLTRTVVLKLDSGLVVRFRAERALVEALVDHFQDPDLRGYSAGSAP